MFQDKIVEKRKNEDKIFKTNCYDCEIMLTKEQMKVGLGNGDKRFFCKTHWKKRFGKKKKLIKRY